MDLFALSQAKQLVQTVILTVTKLLIPHIKSPRSIILMGFPTRYRIVFHSHPHKHLAAATSAMHSLYRAKPRWQLLTLFQASADLTPLVWSVLTQEVEEGQGSRSPLREAMNYIFESLTVPPIKLSKQTGNPQCSMLALNPLLSLVCVCV